MKLGQSKASTESGSQSAVPALLSMMSCIDLNPSQSTTYLQSMHAFGKTEPSLCEALHMQYGPDPTNADYQRRAYALASRGLAEFTTQAEMSTVRLKDYKKMESDLRCAVSACSNAPMAANFLKLAEDLNRLKNRCVVVPGSEEELRLHVRQTGYSTLAELNRQTCRQPVTDRGANQTVEEARQTFREELGKRDDLDAQFALVMEGAPYNEKWDTRFKRDPQLDIFKDQFKDSESLMVDHGLPFSDFKGGDRDMLHVLQGLRAMLSFNFKAGEFQTSGVRGNGCVATGADTEDCEDHLYAHLGAHMVSGVDSVYHHLDRKMATWGVSPQVLKRLRTILNMGQQRVTRALVADIRNKIIRKWDSETQEKYKKIWKRDIGSLDLCDSLLGTGSIDPQQEMADLKVHPTVAAQILVIDQFLNWKISNLYSRFTTDFYFRQHYSAFNIIMRVLDPGSLRDPIYAQNTGKTVFDNLGRVDYGIIVDKVGDFIKGNLKVDNVLYANAVGPESRLLTTDLHKSKIQRNFQQSAQDILAVTFAAMIRGSLLSNGRNRQPADEAHNFLQDMHINSWREVVLPQWQRPNLKDDEVPDRFINADRERPSQLGV